VGGVPDLPRFAKGISTSAKLPGVAEFTAATTCATFGFDKAPSPLTQHDNRNLAACKVLLIAHILVRRHQHFESCGLRFA
jgi:hypothetical protein